MSDHSRRPVLVADIGGTNARFALADTTSRHPLLEASIKRYRVADFATPEDAVHQYIRDTGLTPRQAVFAVAGHIYQGTVNATNSPWEISVTELCRKLDLDSADLINDFAAQSLSLPLLGPKDVVRLGEPDVPAIGSAASQTFAVVGPGTGLGVGALLLRDGHFEALGTEGGHTGFAPDTPEEIDILRFLATRFGHVSKERLISGDGLSLIHEALMAIDGTPGTPLTPEDITAQAQTGDAGCTRAIEHFCAIFGAVAGDAVLALGGWDGVYLAGGLPPRLLSWLTQSTFRERFEAKGRLGDILRRTPSLVVIHPHAGLLGAAASAVVMRGGSLLPGKA
ncbi:MAG TPA: glucokinase [Rhodanobacteraceae bacterium]